jgi:hypothetical protein
MANNSFEEATHEDSQRSEAATDRAPLDLEDEVAP